MLRIIQCYTSLLQYCIRHHVSKEVTYETCPEKHGHNHRDAEGIIQKYKEGKLIIDIARKYSKASSTIATIIKKNDIKGFAVSKGVTLIASKKQQPDILNEVENLLLVWMNKKQLVGDTINETSIYERQRLSTPTSSVGHQALWQMKREHSRPVEAGSKSSRIGLASTVLHAMGKRLVRIRRLQRTSRRSSKRSWSLRATSRSKSSTAMRPGQKRTYITEEETKMPSHKPMKDRLTLLFYSNASGDLKIKPLLVYDSETSWAFKRCRVNKSHLPVM